MTEDTSGIFLIKN